MKYILYVLLLTITSNADTTYEKDAKPIFKDRCSLCHNQNMMPDKNWMDYNIAKKKSKLILKRVWELKDMPPDNGTNITDKERETIKKWVEEGTKK